MIRSWFKPGFSTMPPADASWRMESMEPRLLLSADPFTAQLAELDALATDAAGDEQEQLAHLLASTTAEADPEPAAAEIVFVNDDVPDYHAIIADVSAGAGDRNIEIVLLDASKDGLTQMSDALAGRTGLEAVHVISHGREGGVFLGNTELSNTLSQAQAELVARWGDSLASGADLLFYGCDFAATSDGRALVDRIADLTGADVAASDDLTGAARLGGDWVLEYQTGAIDADLAVSTDLAATFASVLVDVSGTVYEDRDADGEVLDDNIRLSGTVVHLWLDDGDGTPDAGDTPVATTTTDINGDYAFTGLVDLTTYFVSVDSKSLTADYGYNGGWDGGDVWGEQTYGAAGSFDGAGFTASAGSLFGGKQAGVSDDSTDAGTAQHLIRAQFAGADLSGLDFGFSYNVVTHVGDGDDDAGADRTVQGSLRQTIQNANAHVGVQQVDLPAGTYLLTSSDADDIAARGDLDITDSLTLNGAGIGTSIIDADRNHRVFEIADNPMSVTITDLTITGGGGVTNGGGVLVDGNTPDTELRLERVRLTDNTVLALTDGGAIYNGGGLMLVDSQVDANSADIGGGLYNHTGATATISNTSFSGNHAVDDGGAIKNANGATLSITGGTLSGNTADDRGGAINNSQTLDLIGVAISGNYAADDGGGLFNTNAGTATVTDTSFSNNDAFDKGGGINNHGILNLTNVTVSDSDAITGGGLYVANGGTATVTNSTFSGNTVTANGGGIYNRDTLTLINVTIASNAANTGGGLYEHGSASGVLRNTLIADNTASSWANDLSGTINSDGSNFVEDPTGSLGLIVGDITLVDPGLGALADNGGLTKTHALTGGLAVNGGNAGTAPATDQRGEARDASPDIGAFELIAGVNAPPTATITPASYSINEGDTLDLTANGLSIGDADAGSGDVRVILRVDDGTLTVSNGVDTVSGTSIVITGTVSAVQALLDGTAPGAVIDFDTGENPSASITLTLFIDDQGNTGGAAETAQDTATINITRDNDVPLAAIAPASYAVDENTTLDLTANGLSVSDVDAGTGDVVVTLTVGEGTLTVSAGTNTVAVGGAPGNVVTLTGQIEEIQALLDGLNGAVLEYDALDTPSASTTLTLHIDDQGNTGGPAETAQDTATLNINVENDAPVATIGPASYAVSPSTTLDLTANGLSVSDADAGSGNILVTITVGEGTLTASAGTNAVAIGGSPGNMITLTGQVGEIQALLDGLNGAVLDYDEAAIPSASTNLTLHVNDLGSSGGPAETSQDTATLSFTAFNDPPVATIAPASYAVSENTTLDLTANGLSIADIDAGTSAVVVTVSVGEGTLTVSAGTNSVVVGGSPGNAITLTGQVGEIQALLDGLNGAVLDYDAIDLPSATTTLTLHVDDQGNTGGPAETAQDTATLDITAENDAPLAAIAPASYAVTEGTTLDLTANGLSIADLDANGGAVVVTVSVGEGSLTVSAGTNAVVVGGSPGNAVTLTGQVSEIQALLDGLNGAVLDYDAVDLPSATTTLTLHVDDQGNTGGAAETAQDTATLDITQNNDAPIAAIAPASYAVSEGTTFDLTANGLSIADADAGTGDVVVTLSVGEGSLTVSAGTNSVVVGGSPGNAVTLTGQVSEIQALLDGLNGAVLGYDAIDLPSATTTLTLHIDDQGNTGGAAETAEDTATLNITPENDPPAAVIAPASYVVAENTTLALADNGLFIGDVDAVAGDVVVTLSVGEGTLTVSAGTNTVAVGGSPSGSVTLTGQIGEIQALLDGANGAMIGYDAADSPGATTTLTLHIDDQGNTGGPAETAQDTATLNITAENDAPVAAIGPLNYAANEDVLLNLVGTGLVVADADAGTDAVQVVLEVDEGRLLVSAGTNSVTVTGSGTGTVTMTGEVSAINALLAGTGGAVVDFAAADDGSGSANLSLSIDDLGNNGTGGPLTDRDDAAILITTVNDPPTADITPASYAVSDTTPIELAGTGLSVSDPDAGGSVVLATVQVGEGSLAAVAGATGVVVGGSGTGSVTLSGTLTQINDFLAGGSGASLVFTAAANTNTSTTLSLTIDDLGHSGGPGTSETDTDNATLDIARANQAPDADIAAAGYLATEDVVLDLHGTGLAITDPDAGTADVRVTLEVSAGSLSVAPGGNAVAVAGSGSTTVTLTGAQDDIQALLDGDNGATVRYATVDEPTSAVNFTLSVDDLGNAGLGGALDDTANATISVQAINDAPEVSVSTASPSTTAGEPFALHGGWFGLSDDDAGAGDIEVVLSAPAGSLSVSAGSTGVAVAGNGSQSVTLTGTLSAINSLLAGAGGGSVFFDSGTSTDPVVAVTLSVNDLGNTGSGGAKADAGTLNLSVEQEPEVFEAPEVVTPAEAEPDPEPAAAAIPGAAEEDEDSTTDDSTEATEEPVTDTQTAPAAGRNAAGGPAGGDFAQFVVVDAAQAADNATGAGEGQVQEQREAAQGRPASVLLREFLQEEEAAREARLLAGDGTALPLTQEGTQLLTQFLDGVREDAQVQTEDLQVAVASTVTVSTGLSVGYVVWLVRGGVLLSSVLSTLPAWRMVDPLPVLSTLDDEGEEADELMGGVGDDKGLDELVDQTSHMDGPRQ